MNAKEAAQVLTIIKGYYPYITVDQTVLSLWHEALKDIDGVLAIAAIKKHSLTHSEPPSVADIRKQALSIIEPDMDGLQAWELVLKAVQRYGYMEYQKGLGSLPPDVADVARGIGWREICCSEAPEIVRAQFLRCWQSRNERNRQEKMLPEPIRNMIRAIGEQAAKQRALLLSSATTAVKLRHRG